MVARVGVQVRKLGLIGGMSWASTVLYYEAINKGVSRRQGGLVSAPLLIESHDFGPLAELQSAGGWDALAEMMAASARRLARAGAGGRPIASHTMAQVYAQVGRASGRGTVGEEG